MLNQAVCLLCVLFSIVQISHGTLSRDFARLHNEFYLWQLEDRPFSATSRDVHKYDDQIESFNMTSFEGRKVVSTDGSVLRDRESVLDRWKEDFQTLRNGDVTDHSDDVTQNMSDEEEMSTPFIEDIQYREVEKVVFKSKDGKAPGFDDIPSEQ